MKLKVLKFHEKECTFFTSATGLCCTAVLQRYLEVRTVQNTQTAMSWPSRPAASSAMCQLLRATLCGLYCSLALLLLMVQGRHLSRAAVRVIQSDPIAGLRFLSSRHLPHKSVQSLLACNRCQALKCWQCSSPVKYCHPHQL